jgi:hypothetical protein
MTIPHQQTKASEPRSSTTRPRPSISPTCVAQPSGTPSLASATSETSCYALTPISTTRERTAWSLAIGAPR